MFSQVCTRKTIYSSLNPNVIIQRNFIQAANNRSRSIQSRVYFFKPTFVSSPVLASSRSRHFSFSFFGKKPTTQPESTTGSALRETSPSPVQKTSEIFPEASVEPILVNEPFIMDPSPVPDFVASPTTNISNLVHQLGDLKALDLACSYTPVGWVQQALEYIHVQGGLPWWGSIIFVTLVLRTALLPIILKLQVHAAAFSKLRPEIARISDELKEARATKNYLKAHEKARELQSVFKDHNINPFKTMLMPLIQTPIMISFFFAIRNLSYAHVPSFVNESFFWIPQLSVPDPYYILPTAAAALIFTVMELGAEMGGAAQTPGVKLVGRALALGIIPMTYQFPCAIHLYWCTSSLYSLLQTLVFKSPKARKVLGLPPLEALAVNRGQREIKHVMGFLESFQTVRALKLVHNAPPSKLLAK